MSHSDSIQLTLKEKIRHLAYWLVIILFVSIVDPIKGNLFWQIISTSLIMFAYIFTYYLLFLLVFPRYYNKNNSRVILFLLLALLIYLFIHSSSIYLIFNYNKLDDSNNNLTWYILLLNLLLLFFIITVVAFGNFQNRISIIQIKAQSEIEKALLIKELGFFKNQFNSHITFNFLNYCYRYVHETSKEAGDAIQLFSEMLRYTMNSKPDEKVSLKSEMDYIDSFIRLKQLLSKGIYVELSTEGNLQNHTVLPRLLITFVENAFKHGKTHEELAPILISLYANPEQLIFEVKNKKNKSKIPLSTGIGQNNVKNQLELFYKNKYNLEISEDDDNYACKLVLTV